MWKIPTNDDLYQFLNYYEQSLITKSKVKSTIQEFNKVTKNQLMLDGIYKQGIDKYHNDYLEFTREINGYIFEFHVFSWKFVNTNTGGIACQAKKGTITIKLSALKAVSMKTEITQGKHLIRLAIALLILTFTLVGLITIGRPLIPFGNDKIIITGIYILLPILIVMIVLGIKNLNSYQGLIKKYQAWTRHNLIAHEW